MAERIKIIAVAMAGMGDRYVIYFGQDILYGYENQ